MVNAVPVETPPGVHLGMRLRQARLALGLTQAQVAAALRPPVTAQAVSKFELGLATPTNRTLIELARVLKTTPAWLLSAPSVDIRWVAFRKHSALSARDQERLKAFAQPRVEGELRLRSLFGSMPAFEAPAGLEVATSEQAEAAAARLREAWGLGDEPIASVIGTAEEHGVVVIGWREGERFDALSGRAGEAAVIVYNAARSADRVRFTLAHELGHLVMDCASGADAEERLAHRFAGAFLVPRAAVIASLGRNRRSLGIAELGLLKQRWGLSIQGWVRRAFDCGVIDGAVYERLNRTIRARGLHRIEPFPCPFDEVPQLGRRLAWHAVEERLLTREQAASLAPGLEESPEAALSARDTSWRSLAAMSAEERARYLAEAPVAVDPAETDAWDAATLGDLEATAEP